MGNIGYRIIKDINRPDPQLIQQFKEVPIANIDDCMSRTAALPSRIHALNDKQLIGSAYTVNCPAGDNLLFYYAIDNAKPGDVIVVANNGYTERALCGEIMATLAMKRGIAGFIIDGAIRDKAALEKMDFPVFAVASNINGPYKNGPGEINVPVSIGAKVVNPGDILVGDPDGVVVISPDIADEVYQKSLAVIKKEAAMMKSIEENNALDLSWMYEKIAKDQCEII